MNDQHAHAGYVGYDEYSTTGSFDADPLFGALPGGYEAGHSGQYDSTQWGTGSRQTAGYDVYGAQQAQQPQYTQQFPQYDATGATGQYDTSAVQYDTTGQWDADAWNQTTQTGQYETAAATFAYDTPGQWAAPAFETGTYDAAAWNTGAEALVPQQITPQHEFLHAEFHGEATYEGLTSEFQPDFQAEFQPGLTTEFEATEFEATEFETAQFAAEPEPEAHFEAEAEPEPEADDEPDAASESESEFTPEPEPLSAAVIPRPVRRSGGSRGRRRTPAKRSALLTVAVPSACVMGVAGIAAASVGNLGSDSKNAPQAAADPSSVKPVAANNKMDTQLAALSADARDFGDRASRVQARLDLKARQAAEKEKREEEARRKEALRPKFALPLTSKVVGSRFGEVGVNWMTVHTGVDFPVPYGTPVMAATDGTMRSQWNSSYGNMIILTAPDGTQTWYNHLQSAKYRSATVKAGDVIGYAGSSGNSTGPHLHFEVRPGGGAPIDPLPWLRSHGLDPT